MSNTILIKSAVAFQSFLETSGAGKVSEKNGKYRKI